ncbi:hypothetical protein [Pontibacter pamirensis]|uniref:hypothetical protein n=1 Tax=Pontibacter pamirensis TaxID=2562824 RepID=UPI00138A26A5|nr:hypothetical protein [Pontibacter pamirensis]
MNKLYKLMLGLLLPMAALAQEEVAVVLLSELPMPVNSVNGIAQAADEAGNICLQITSDDSLQHSSTVQLISLSPEGQVLSKAKHYPVLFTNQELIGVSVRPQHFNFYRFNKKATTHRVLGFQVEKSTGLSTSLPAITLNIDPKSKYVTSFVEGNEVVMLYYLKKPSSVQVVRIDTAGQQHLSTIPVNIDNASDHFLRYGDIIYINDQTAKTVFATHHQKKVYKQGNKLYFVFDAYTPVHSTKATTEILELDISAGTSQLIKLPDLPIAASSDFNSYLFKGRIFRLFLSHHDLGITVFDLHTTEPLAAYLFRKDNELTLKSTPVTMLGVADNSYTDNKVLVKTSQVLHKMDKGKPAIVVEDLGNKVLQLTVGSYKEAVQYSGGGMMMPVGGGSFSTPGGMVPAPTTWRYMGTPGTSTHSSGVSTFFKAFVDADTYQKTENAKFTSLQDQLEAYEEVLRRINTTVGVKTHFRNNGKAYMVYEDKDEKALKLVMFTETAPQ